MGKRLGAKLRTRGVSRGIRGFANVGRQWDALCLEMGHHGVDDRAAWLWRPCVGSELRGDLRSGCVASVAVRSDRRKQNKGSAGDHREVAMHHATNTLPKHALWCAANVHRWCVCGVDAFATSFPQVHLQCLRPGNLAAFQPS